MRAKERQAHLKEVRLHAMLYEIGETVKAAEQLAIKFNILGRQLGLQNAKTGQAAVIMIGLLLAISWPTIVWKSLISPVS